MHNIDLLDALRSGRCGIVRIGAVLSLLITIKIILNKSFMKITLLNRRIAQIAWRIAKRFDPRLQAVDPDVQAVFDEVVQTGSSTPIPALDELRTRLQDAMQEIDGLAAVPEAKPISISAPLAPERLRGRLAQLAQALEYDLGAAEPLLTELRAGVRDTALAEEIAALAARTDAFDIDQVLIQLNVLQERLKSTG